MLNFPTDRSIGELLTPAEHAHIEALPLFVHQREFLNQQLTEHGSRLLAGEPGTGKTLVAIGLTLAVTLAKHSHNFTTPVIYAMPANLVRQVAREFERFAPQLRVALLRTGKDKIPVNFDVLLISYTLPVASRRIAESIAALTPFALLVFDESHLLRNVQAKRTRFWVGLTRKTRWTLLMSGTPMVNSPEDLFSSFRVLDLLDAPGIGRVADDGGLRPVNYREFCADFVVYKPMLIAGRRFTKAAGAKNTDRLNKALATRTTRWVAKQLLSLPALLHGQHFLDIPDPLDEMLAGEIKPSPALLRLRALRDRRRTGGTVSNDEMDRALAAVSNMELSTYRRVVGVAKAPGVAQFVVDRLEAGGAPSLVFGHHREALDTIKTALDENEVAAELIYGDTPSGKRDRSIQAFQTGELDVLVLQIDVAGLGLNLQRAGYVAFAELPWTAAAYDQAIARAHRAGQQQHVLVEIVTVPDSLDEIMIRTIHRKAGEARAVFDRPAA